MDESVDLPAEQPAAAPPVPPPAPAIRLPGPPTRESRATLTFTIVAAFLLLALIVVSTQAGYIGGTGGAFISALLAIATAIIEAWGLSQNRSWARSAMTPMLWIYVAAGALVFVLTLARGGINIPIGALLAAWALTARPSEALGPVPGSSTEGTLLIAGLAVATLIQFL